MKKFLFAPALAALVMFVFGALVWASPLPYRVLNRVPDDAAAMDALARAFPTTGTYLVPGMYLDSAKHAELVQKGPIAEVHFVAHGMSPLEPRTLVLGYIHEFAVCLVLVLMLDFVMPAFRGFRCIVRLCAMLGLLLALYDYTAAIWWNHSIAWQTVQALYDFIAFVLVGLVLGKMLAPKQVVAATPAPAVAAAR
jgi:hypothetical protein